jgi:hypothetical protein
MLAGLGVTAGEQTEMLRRRLAAPHSGVPLLAPRVRAYSPTEPSMASRIRSTCPL